MSQQNIITGPSVVVQTCNFSFMGDRVAGSESEAYTGESLKSELKSKRDWELGSSDRAFT
jgi:hypothetical protein